MTDDVVLEFSLASRADLHVVHVRGEIDILSGPVLQAALVALSGLDGGILLDLRDVTFVDSSGLRALTDVWQACRAADRPFTIQGPLQPSVAKLLHLTALDRELPISVREDLS